MENRKHIQVLGYIALYFFPKYQNDDVTGGGGGEVVGKMPRLSLMRKGSCLFESGVV